MKNHIYISGICALLLLTTTIGAAYHNPTLKNAVDHIEPTNRDLGDLVFMYGLENATSDFQTIGCGTNGTHFFITGGNSGDAVNKVYIFDYAGNYLSSFDQPGTSLWGWLDLAYDGEYFYGGEQDTSTIDKFTEDGTIVATIPGPAPWCAGLAYDPVSDHLWTIDKWTDKILYEIDMSGTVINQYTTPYNIYGLAWDDVSPGGPFIWCAAQEPQCTFFQFDPNVGAFTGVSFDGVPPGTVTDNKAAGLGFIGDWDGNAILFAIQQCDQNPDGPGDQLGGYVVYDGTADTTPPITTCNLDGSMSGDEYYGDVTVTLTATDDLSGVNYTMYKIDSGTYQEYTGPFMVSDIGDHTIYFYSVDNADNIENEKTCEFTIFCPIELTVGGGLGVSATITNSLDESLTDISWRITFSGGLILIGKDKTGNIEELAAGSSTDISSGLVLGFGKPTLTITAGCAEYSTQPLVLLFLVLGIK